jgi:hypothetical protein
MSQYELRVVRDPIQCKRVVWACTCASARHNGIILSLVASNQAAKNMLSMQGQVQQAGLEAAAHVRGKEVPQDSPAVDRVRWYNRGFMARWPSWPLTVPRDSNVRGSQLSQLL